MSSLQNLLVHLSLLLATVWGPTLGDDAACAQYTNEWNTLKNDISSLKSKLNVVAQLSSDADSLSSRMTDLQTRSKFNMFLLVNQYDKNVVVWPLNTACLVSVVRNRLLTSVENVRKVMYFCHIHTNTYIHMHTTYAHTHARAHARTHMKSVTYLYLVHRMTLVLFHSLCHITIPQTIYFMRAPWCRPSILLHLYPIPK